MPNTTFLSRSGRRPTSRSTARLTADLQRSRERLVTAREEERRRLRRDLHDGLGPQLAAQTLKVGSARSLYGRDPAAADALLSDLEANMEASIADIRRLVYNLRQPSTSWGWRRHPRERGTVCHERVEHLG